MPASLQVAMTTFLIVFLAVYLLVEMPFVLLGIAIAFLVVWAVAR